MSNIYKTIDLFGMQVYFDFLRINNTKFNYMRTKEEILKARLSDNYLTNGQWNAILEIMEEYAQEVVKNLNIPAVVRSALITNKMKTENEIKVRIGGIIDSINDIKEELKKNELQMSERQELIEDMAQLNDRMKILEWVLS
jgi:hypothetical protein